MASPMNASDDSDSAYKRLADVLSKWNELFDRSQIPPVLYHYTTFDGLHGILKDSALRATFSETLNDGSEWEFGKSVIRRYPIPEGTSQEPAPPPSMVIPPPKAIFVTCFCEESNLLSMWRSYTGQGGGFCLGFEGPKLNTLQRDNLIVGSFAARLVKVYYGEKPRSELEQLLRCGGHSMAEWVLENMIKHHGFQEEKEWRIIVPDPPASLMSFHSGNANIKASVQIRNHQGDGKLPLRKIVYGPTLRNDTALARTLSWMLDKYGYGDVALKASEIPYRL
jgi:Protein of unknown function (DUF2971)